MVALVWTKLPAQVPVHWNFEGHADGYAGRAALWLLAVLNPLLALMMGFTLKADPKRDNYRKFQTSYDSFRLLLALFMDAVILSMLVEALRPGTVSIGRIIQMLVALLMAGMGNMMPKIRQNYFFGLKTPWTLASESVWAKTHRLGGQMLFAAGVLNLPCAFLPAPWNFAALMTGALAASLVPLVMSFLWYRQEADGKTT